MEVIKQVVQFFLLSLSLGLVGCRPFTSLQQTGLGFQKLVDAVALASFILFSFLFVLSFANLKIIFVILVLALLFSTTFFIKKENQKSLNYIGYAKIILLSMVAFLFTHTNLVLWSFFIITSCLVGIVVYSMLLGHYYLVVPKLSEKILLKVVKVFFFILILKIVCSLYGLYKAEQFLSLEGHMDSLFNLIIVLMRLLWGYVALAIIGFFSYKLTKMNSIQSATGLLYVMVFFMIIGEVISIYLYYQHGIFI